ncbi:MAG: B12-binding domain-containing radical SAM protein [Planctomycetota bacterium]
MERLLIFPPFADPTQAYPSLPVLKGSLRSRGLDVRTLDLNVRAAHHLFDPGTVEDLAFRVGRRFLALNRARELTFEEAREYRALAAARPEVERALAAGPSPLEVFRDRNLFFDAARYSLAQRVSDGLFEALSAASFPFRLDWNQAADEILPWSLDRLERYAREGRSPLESFYRRLFAEGAWAEAGPGGEAPASPPGGVEFVGISVVFPSQIAEAYALAGLAKEAFPGAFVAFGGPAIHQIALRAGDEVVARLLEAADGIGIYEGEETLAALFRALPEWRASRDARRRFEALRGVPNLLARDPETGLPRAGRFSRVDLAGAPAPDFSDLDLDAYLAPSRTILYPPTRGCYWNRCSFCHYGLAERGTAPYREVPPELAASHLARLSRRHGVRNVYLSCDVLSPSYALRFARALEDRGLKMRWSSDFRIERAYDLEACRVLYRSGLRAVAFGVESGSDRVLELVRKGCDRRTISEVNRAFHEAGIATQWMAFTGHPGETVEEALETVRWIEAEADAVDLFFVGEFGLEAGSDVARDPRRYGVERIYYAAGDDLRVHALFDVRGGRRSAADRERIDAAIRKAAAGYALRPYPWAGAVSTHHTFLHTLEFGPRAFRTHFQRAEREARAPLGPPPPSHIPGLRERARFSVREIERREREFFARYLSRALAPRPVATREAGGGGGEEFVAPLSEEDFLRASARAPPHRTGAERGRGRRSRRRALTPARRGPAPRLPRGSRRCLARSLRPWASG